MGHHALVLERIEAAEDLRAYSLRRRVFSREIAESLGKCIALLHRLTRDTGGDHPLRKLNRQPPWILSLHEPGLLAYLSASAANLDVIKLMQAHSEFTNLLEAVRRDWNAEALIHFDLKWDNCLVHRMPGGAPRTRVRLLDWELAQFGDPWWDVGCVFASYLATWLLSMPLTADIPAQNLLGLAKYPLGSMQPAMRSFWTRYTGEVSLPVSEQPIYLIRSVRYAAARLVQLAYEQTQQSMQMPGSAICALQVALNMLKYPADAMTHLLGITPPPPRRN